MLLPPPIMGPPIMGPMGPPKGPPRMPGGPPRMGPGPPRIMPLPMGPGMPPRIMPRMGGPPLIIPRIIGLEGRKEERFGYNFPWYSAGRLLRPRIEGQLDCKVDFWQVPTLFFCIN